MEHICIISSSIRKDRFSHRAALYLSKILKDKFQIDAEILDLQKYKFPLFEERLKYLDSATPETLDFAERVKKADGLILVVPEYNGGYPASIKNVIDLLTDEWRKKPVAFAVVSNGQFGGSQVIFSLQFALFTPLGCRNNNNWSIITTSQFYKIIHYRINSATASDNNQCPVFWTNIDTVIHGILPIKTT